MAFMDQFGGQLTAIMESANLPAEETTEEPQSVLNDMTASEDTSDYVDLIMDSVFVGDYSWDSIKEGIENQFSNYIAHEDETNYVEIFYKQLKASYAALNDEEEEHPQEIREALDRILDRFNAFMANMFRQKIQITLTDLNEGVSNPSETETTISLLYEYFILNARKNFMKVITTDIERRMGSRTPANDDEFYQIAREMLPDYSPLMQVVLPREFLRISAPSDVIERFDDGVFTGDFLRRYRCQLYDHEDLEVEILAHIAAVHGVKEDFKNEYLKQSAPADVDSGSDVLR